MRKLGFIIGIIVLLMAVMPVSNGLPAQAAAEPPGWYWKPGNFTDYAPSGMPDFDQKQDMWRNPPVGGVWSYCGPVAVANSLWWFDSKNEPNPQPPSNISDHYGLVTNYSAPWDDHDPQNVQPLVNDLAWLMDTDGQRTQIAHNGTNIADMQWGIDQYLINKGYNAAYNETTVPWPDFYWIKEEVERCQDVVLLLGFYQNYTGYYERVGGHYVTVAGVNLTGLQLGISDPYIDNAEAGGPGVVPVAHNHTANGTGTHNDTQYVSHDIYNVTQILPGPGGPPSPCWALQNYANGSLIVFGNFQGQNGGGVPYSPAHPVVTIIDYAVDVSPTAATYNLTMAVNGSGTTTPAVGSYSYTAGTVPITATPGAGWQFVNWTTANIAEIANPAAASTTVTVDENKTVTANFALSPGWYWKPGNWTDYALSGMPDFDQKQDMWGTPVPPPPWTYCGPVAVANSLWWFDSKNEPSPQPPSTINDHYGLVTNFSNQWDDHDPQNVMPLVCNLSWLMDTDGQRTQIAHNGTDVMDMQQGIRDYLNATGYAAAYNETTVLRPNFTWIEGEVERCEDVVLLLGFWQHEYGSDYWWRVGGHYVTVAGVNSNTSQLGISDPYFDNAEAGGAGVVPVSHAYPHGADVHNDTQYVSHDIYNVTFIAPVPGHLWPCWALQNYAGGTPIVNFQGQNSGPLLTPPGPYNPQQGFQVETVIDYAVAVSPITGATATLEGHVTFSGRGAAGTDKWIESFEVKGFESGNLSHVLWTTNATTNNTGVFTVTGLTSGTYDISIKNWTCLSEKVVGVALNSTAVVDFGTTREGDANNDDWITGADRSILYAGWGTQSPNPGYNWKADLNRDGWLTGADRSIMYNYWGQKGDLIP